LGKTNGVISGKITCVLNRRQKATVRKLKLDRKETALEPENTLPHTSRLGAWYRHDSLAEVLQRITGHGNQDRPAKDRLKSLIG
jgi:hypothetical protein